MHWKGQTAVRTALAIGVIAFVVELGTMLLLTHREMFYEAIPWGLIDAAIVSVCTTLAAYGLVLVPLERAHRRRLEAERSASVQLRLARTDALTGCLNRRGITERLSESLAEAHRYARRFSVALIDIDHFKQINDRHGHGTGDEVLRLAVATMNQTLRLADKLGRMGGDEFIVVLPGIDHRGSAAIAGRICDALSETELRSGSRRVRVSVSVGSTEWSLGEGEKELLARVDDALYRAKRAGGNDCVSVPAPAAP